MHAVNNRTLRSWSLLFRQAFRYMYTEKRNRVNSSPSLTLSTVIIYIKILLDCDWLISVQLIPNSSAIFCNHSAIFRNHSAKICNKLIWLVEKHCDDKINQSV
jgi:hypothetical protein